MKRRDRLSVVYKGLYFLLVIAAILILVSTGIFKFLFGISIKKVIISVTEFLVASGLIFLIMPYCGYKVFLEVSAFAQKELFENLRLSLIEPYLITGTNEIWEIIRSGEKVYAESPEQAVFIKLFMGKDDKQLMVEYVSNDLLMKFDVKSIMGEINYLRSKYGLRVYEGEAYSEMLRKGFLVTPG